MTRKTFIVLVCIAMLLLSGCELEPPMGSVDNGWVLISDSVEESLYERVGEHTVCYRHERIAHKTEMWCVPIVETAP